MSAEAIAVTTDLLFTPRAAVDAKQPVALLWLGVFAPGFLIDQVTGIAVDAAFRSAF